MEFSGVPDIGKNFVSKYYAVRSDSNTLSNFSSTKFDQLIGKTITISYTDANGQTVGTDTITLTAAGISAAAHLVGAKKMAEAMAEIYSDCFTTDAQGNVIQTSSTATLLTTGFADGNGVAFSTYVKLLQDYDISPMLNANSLTDFNQLTKDLITYRKDNIINYLTAKRQEVAMSVSAGSTDYKETIRSILQGLGLSTDNLNTIDGQVILAGANNSKYTDKADLVFGLGNGSNILSGGKGNDILEGGAGNDDYYFSSGDGNDKIIDNEGENAIIWVDANNKAMVMKTFYKSGDAEWTSPDGTASVNKKSPYKIVLPDGGIIELGEDISSFGINLLDTPANPVTNNTITGNEAANIIRDTSANDRIEAGSGNDGIWAGNGGDNWLLGGEGNDAIIAYETSGSDIIEGGSGVDVLAGGTGDDQIFGENKGEMEDIIAAGETAQSINEKGDLLSGAAGNDFLYGSNKKDAHFFNYGGSTSIEFRGRRALYNGIFKLAA